MSEDAEYGCGCFMVMLGVAVVIVAIGAFIYIVRHS